MLQYLRKALGYLGPGKLLLAAALLCVTPCCSQTVLNTVCEQVDIDSGGCTHRWNWSLSDNDYQIHYVEMGSGDRHVLLVHGYAASTYTWRKVMQSLAASGYHVWALDLLGFGRSDKPEDISYSLDLFVEQVRRFIHEKQLRNLNIIGHSMGGAISLGVIMREPGLANSLVIVDSLGYPQDVPWWIRLCRGLGNWLKPLLSSKSAVERLLRASSHKDIVLTEIDIDRFYQPLCEEGGRTAVVQLLQKCNAEELARFSLGFRSIQLPVLILWGDDDTTIPVSHAYKFHRDLRRSHLRVLSNCGHSPQEERPEILLQSILVFFKRYSSVD